MKIKTQTIEGYSTPSMCVDNVDRIVKDRGGEIVVCKLIVSDWAQPIYGQWVKHAVWKMPDGVIVDITPQDWHDALPSEVEISTDVDFKLYE